MKVLPLPPDAESATKGAMMGKGGNMPTVDLAEGERNGTGRQVISMNPRYHDGLVAFKKRCTDYSSIMGFLNSIFERGDIKASLQARSSIQVVDIGCGDGTITTHLASLLTKTTSGEITLDVVEPVEYYIVQTKEKLRPLTKQGFNVTYTKEKAEDYFASPSNGGHYDLVFSSHNFHLIPLDTLSSITSSLKPGGYFVVVIGARSSIMSTLKDLFILRPAITGEDILKFMQDSFPDLEISATSQPSFLDLRGIGFPESKKGLTEEAKNILSLMLQKNVDDVDQAGYSKIRRLILEKLQDGQLQLDNDCLIFRKPKNG